MTRSSNWDVPEIQELELSLPDVLAVPLGQSIESWFDADSARRQKASAASLRAGEHDPA